MRGIVAFLLAVGLMAASVGASREGSIGGMIAAAAGAALFAVAAFNAARRASSTTAPLSLDSSGLAVDDGLHHRWQVEWSAIAGVRIERSLLHRRVVLVVLDREDIPSLRAIPLACHAEIPAEWLAGLIETFRTEGWPRATRVDAATSPESATH